MLRQFRSHISQNYPDLRDKKILLACSGGVDSMVLLHLCLETELKLSVAHCNFQLRGTASDQDAEFVRDTATSLGLPYHQKNFDTESYATTHRGSVQMAARQLRYSWFRQLMRELDYDCLLTAHHLDDAMETFLINLSRGSGLAGLSGIPSGEGAMIRPLLPFSREQVLQYAKENELAWREDESNQDPKYLRNRVRKEILPGLRTMHPTFDANFSKTMNHLKGSKALLGHYREKLVQELFLREAQCSRIPIKKLEKLSPIEDYLYLLFEPYGFTQPAAILELFDAANSKGLYSASHRLLKDREHLLLSTVPGEEKAGRVEDLDVAGIEVAKVAAMGKTSMSTIYVDKEKLNGPLYLKKWEKGDYFYPFGMKGKQKLSKYFKDHKFDAIQKEQQWLLCSGDSIVWMIGQRADDRFRVDEQTREILKITCQE